VHWAHSSHKPPHEGARSAALDGCCARAQRRRSQHRRTALGGQQFVGGSRGHVLSGLAALVPQPLGSARHSARSSVHPVLPLHLAQYSPSWQKPGVAPQGEPSGSDLPQGEPSAPHAGAAGARAVARAGAGAACAGACAAAPGGKRESRGAQASARGTAWIAAPGGRGAAGRRCGLPAGRLPGRAAGAARAATTAAPAAAAMAPHPA
jgi:hypothetical protein